MQWQFPTVLYEGVLRNFNTRDVVNSIVCCCQLHLSDDFLQERIYYVQNTTLDAISTVISAMYRL